MVAWLAGFRDWVVGWIGMWILAKKHQIAMDVLARRWMVWGLRHLWFVESTTVLVLVTIVR